MYRTSRATTTCCTRINIMLILLMLQQLPLIPAAVRLIPTVVPSMKCVVGDTACLERCKPGTIRDPVRTAVETECPRGVLKMESLEVCWKGWTLPQAANLTVSRITNSSARLSWPPQDEWRSRRAELVYDCQLGRRVYLAKFFQKPTPRREPQEGRCVGGQSKAGGAAWDSVELPGRVTGTLDAEAAASGSVVVEGLLPNQQYYCGIWTLLNGFKGPTVSRVITTKPGVPAFPVFQLKYQYVPSKSIISLHWKRSRPYTDRVSGYKVTLGNDDLVQLVGPWEEQYEISEDNWSRVASKGSIRRVSVTVAPFNAVGTGPATTASLMLPPYDNYYIPRHSCAGDTDSAVHVFEEPAEVYPPKVCYREYDYRECYL